MAKPKKPPRWYFSLRSPYSWFAYQELTERYPDVLDAVDWIPYWEPDPESERLLTEAGVTLPVVDMTRAKNFYILQDTRRWARARGWTMNWPIDREPQWEVAHLAYLVAEEHGKGREYVAAVYRARWEHSKNISERATIAEIAVELGLDADRMANALDDPQIRRRGVELLVAASRDDAFGVPFFVNGREKFWGAERVAAFAASVRGVEITDPDQLSWQGAMPEFPELVKAGGDAGHAGGCG